MEIAGERVAVYHATPLCRSCKDEVSRIQKVSAKEGAVTEVSSRC